ncbi:MAG: carboxypeptidase-like regulatory domain-containing protein, partial [Bryobacteraceae bacterium]
MHLRATGVSFAFLLALLIPGLLLGQNNVSGAGTITGRVTDATGAIVTDATVTITDTETNIVTTDTSNASGLYIFENVKPGI